MRRRTVDLVEEDDVGVSKSLNRLAILGLLACGGAWAQDTVSVQVGLTIPGPVFLVDGQLYSSPKSFNGWSEATTRCTSSSLRNRMEPWEITSIRPRPEFATPSAAGT